MKTETIYTVWKDVAVEELVDKETGNWIERTAYEVGSEDYQRIKGRSDAVIINKMKELNQLKKEFLIEADRRLKFDRKLEDQLYSHYEYKYKDELATLLDRGDISTWGIDEEGMLREYLFTLDKILEDSDLKLIGGDMESAIPNCLDGWARQVREVIESILGDYGFCVEKNYVYLLNNEYLVVEELTVITEAKKRYSFDSEADLKVWIKEYQDSIGVYNPVIQNNYGLWRLFELDN